MRGGNILEPGIRDSSNLSSMIMVGGYHVEEKAIAGMNGGLQPKREEKIRC